MDIITRVPGKPLNVGVVGTSVLWACINLAGPGGSFISLDSLADCDRLITAACDAKRMLELAIACTPHAYEAGAGNYGVDCTRCGRLESEAAHEACPAVAEHTGVTCTLPAGHDGRHESADRIVWGPGVTEPDPHAPKVVPSVVVGEHPYPEVELHDPTVTPERVPEPVLCQAHGGECHAHHPLDGMACEVKVPHGKHAYVPFGDTVPVTWTDADQADVARPAAVVLPMAPESILSLSDPDADLVAPAPACACVHSRYRHEQPDSDDGRPGGCLARGCDCKGYTPRTAATPVSPFGPVASGLVAPDPAPASVAQ